MPNTSSSSGFSFIELIVALAILVMVAAVVTPNLVSTMDRARVDKGIESLEAIATGVHEFHEHTNHHPGQLSQLVQPITIADRNSCGATFPPGAAEKWGGPYLQRLIPATGLPAIIGIASNQLTRTPPQQGGGSGPGGPTGQAGLLSVSVAGVREEDAMDVDARVDADGDRAAGSIQWTTPDAGSGLVTLSYVVPINGC